MRMSFLGREEYGEEIRVRARARMELRMRNMDSAWR